MLEIEPIFKITSRTKDKNFKAKSASFYVDLNQLATLMSQKVITIEHINVDTNEVRYVTVKGMVLYNQALTRRIKGKTYCVYRY